MQSFRIWGRLQARNGVICYLSRHFQDYPVRRLRANMARNCAGVIRCNYKEADGAVRQVRLLTS